MSESIEFHDSRLTSIHFVGTSMLIDVRAYVHRWERLEGVLKGTGWIRPVRISLSDAAGDPPSDTPLDLYGGEVRAGQVLHESLVPLPFYSPQSDSTCP
jgi:hypothetical protein